MNIQTMSVLLNFIERVPVTGTQEAQSLLICKQELAQDLQAAMEEQNAAETATDDRPAKSAADGSGKK